MSKPPNKTNKTKRSRKIIACYLVTIIFSLGMLSMPVFGAAAAEAPSAWAEDEIAEAIALGLVPANLQSGYSQAVTRAEFCALGVALFEATVGDLFTNIWKFDDTDDINVGKMAEVNVARGVGNNRFKPGNPLTREQAAAMLDRIVMYIDRGRIVHPVREAMYFDNDEISDWAFVAEFMTANGLMLEADDNYFYPRAPYTRGQSIVSMLRVYKLLMFDYEYFDVYRELSSFEEAMEYFMPSKDDYDYNTQAIYNRRVINTVVCSIIRGHFSRGPHGSSACIRLIYKSGSQPGEGTVIDLPMPDMNGWGLRAPPDELLFDEKSMTLTYSYFIDSKMEVKGPDGFIIHRAGTYRYTVDLRTGVTTLNLSNN